MRARASTIGLNCGCVVTSATRSPLTHTSRPSRSDSRYSSPVRIMQASSRRDRHAGGELLGDASCAPPAVGEQVTRDAHDLALREELAEERKADLVVGLPEQRRDD